MSCLLLFGFVLSNDNLQDLCVANSALSDEHCDETFNPSPLPLHKGRALKPPPYVRGIEGVKVYCFESDKV
jgi:hypothetical protein